jgi:hypothetical protein
MSVKEDKKKLLQVEYSIPDKEVKKSVGRDYRKWVQSCAKGRRFCTK